ncbi:MAG: hypothetical protein WDO18_16240 [Acidobacteriota bacterium]
MMLATTLLVAVLSQPNYAAQLRDQMIKNSYPAEEVTKLFEMLQNPRRWDCCCWTDSFQRRC